MTATTSRDRVRALSYLTGLRPDLAWLTAATFIDGAALLLMQPPIAGAAEGAVALLAAIVPPDDAQRTIGLLMGRSDEPRLALPDDPFALEDTDDPLQLPTVGEWLAAGAPTLGSAPLPAALDPTLQAQINQRWKRLLEQYEHRMTTGWAVYEIPVVAGRYALVEKSVLDGGHWLSAHDTPVDASSYAMGQESPYEWEPLVLIDLLTTTTYEPDLRLLWVPQREGQPS